MATFIVLIRIPRLNHNFWNKKLTPFGTLKACTKFNKENMNNVVCISWYIIVKLISIFPFPGYAKVENYWTGYFLSMTLYLIFSEHFSRASYLSKKFYYLLQGWKICRRRCKSHHGTDFKRGCILPSSGCGPP